MSSLEKTDRGDWQAFAACAGAMGAAFYPPFRPERKTVRVGRENRAKAVCASCSVRTDCLAQALANNERFGIWGGLTGRERRLAVAPSDNS